MAAQRFLGVLQGLAARSVLLWWRWCVESGRALCKRMVSVSRTLEGFHAGQASGWASIGCLLAVRTAGHFMGLRRAFQHSPCPCCCTQL